MRAARLRPENRESVGGGPGLPPATNHEEDVRRLFLHRERSFFDIRFGLRLHDSLAERGSHYLVHRGIYPYNLCLVPCVLFVLSMNVLTIGKESTGQVVGD